MLQKSKSAFLKLIFKSIKMGILQYRIKNRNAKLLWYPKITSVDDLNREISRCIWYVHPVLDHVEKIVFVINENMKDIFLKNFVCPEYADPSITEMADQFDTLLHFVSEKEFLSHKMSDYDIVVQWHRTLSKKLIYPYVIDADVRENQFEANQIVQIANLICKSYKQLTKKNLQKFSVFFESLNLKKLDDIVLIGSGPSVKNLKNINIDQEKTISIVCNSVVKNNEIFERLKPHIIVASDSVFHSGYSKYASEFRQMLTSRLESDKKIIFIVPMRDYLIYTKNLSAGYAENVIGIPVKRVRRFNYDLTNHFFVKSTSNVLSLIMLPLAATFKKNVFLLGFDGRREGDKDIFWQYDQQSQFEDAYDFTKMAHPAFYKVNYHKYYEKHCYVMQQLIDEFPDNSIRLKILSPSHIPALSRFNA